ncbi:MAG TPA: hypothetical protein VFL88_05260 [Gemmatimonadales bacterium]|jgi:hypothetical protein|nr:hypothetical protein [Gemmatimonadales bacterium]
MPRRLTLTRLLLIITLTGLAGCAANPGQEQPKAEQPLPADNVTLVVTNRSTWDMDVYLVREGLSSRLGLAPGGMSTRYSLTPAQFIGGGQIRILAKPLVSGRTVTSEPLTLSRGQEVTWDIPPR